MRTTILYTVTALSCVPAFVTPLTPKAQHGALGSHQPHLVRRTTASSSPLVYSSSLRSSSLRAGTSPALMTAASLEAAGGATPSGTGVTPSIINLFKNIVGSGVLALAAGVAAFSGSPLALLPSLAILLAVGAASAYTFSTIARVGAATGGTTYRETWAKVFGEKTAFITDATTIFMCAAAGLSYSIIIGDSFASIAKLAGFTGVLASPNAWIVFLSTFVLLPLSLLRDLSALAIGSVVGTAGTVYTALFVFLRYFDKSYLAGGKFNLAIAESMRPVFSAPTAARPLFNPSMFVLVSMLASAFLAHYNAPKFYNELESPPDGSPKLGRFNFVVAAAFAAAAGLMGSVMAGGFLTFGSAANGLILNNYATSDPLAFLARLGIGLSIVFSYPLNFVGLRDGILSIAGKAEEGKKNSVHVAVTVALMLLMNGASLFIKDLGLIVGLGGAILGSALVYIYPALMAACETSGAMGKAEKLMNWGLTGVGVFFAGLGAVMCLK